ncbi:hypothetical protein Poly51_15900 [Rubripirellula tenax]|uniref:Uncharacterized protein n=1 Tax=Rubripirellula tenax TaxID=2528015 RepID=A0A5C6FDY7_9BACT|nr:hypothetical protein Poly51_15900 [Rubripirellula tenax]
MFGVASIPERVSGFGSPNAALRRRRRVSLGFRELLCSSRPASGVAGPRRVVRLVVADQHLC